MSSVDAGRIFNTDYTDYDKVVALATDLARNGPAQIVIKYPNRPNFNITFAWREKKLPPEVKVLWRSSNTQGD